MFLLAVMGLSLSAPQNSAICNFARVKTDRKAAWVHRRNDAKSPRIKRLAPDAVVYTCDESRREDGTGRWVFIRFGDPDHRCPIMANGLTQRLANRCLSGWMRDEDINVISG